MPVFETSLMLTRPPTEVFALFVQPAEMVSTAPPELSLGLEEAPLRLSLGARTVIAGRRWGMSHRSVLEVTAFEEGRLVVEEQRQGPFRRWVQSHLFEPTEGGTRLTVKVDFEKPGGILGLTVTESFIRRELEWVFAYRTERLREILG